MRILTVTAVTAVLVAVATTGVTQASPAPRRARPDRADWQTITDAAHNRNLGLERHRTAHFRAFAGELGLNELSTVQPLAPGRCRAAVRALYGNLLDLANAHPGENWEPLRRFVAKEPSIRACAPRRAQPQPS